MPSGGVLSILESPGRWILPGHFKSSAKGLSTPLLQSNCFLLHVHFHLLMSMAASCRITMEGHALSCRVKAEANLERSLLYSDTRTHNEACSSCVQALHLLSLHVRVHISRLAGMECIFEEEGKGGMEPSGQSLAQSTCAQDWYCMQAARLA